jgi:hypothetical protein
VRDFNLGIIGGCLTHQRGIAKSELYHQRLAKRLERSEGIRLRVRIARDFKQEHVFRLESLLQEHRLDAVMVHVRSEFSRKAAFVITVHTDGEFRYYLHPFLFRPWRSGWATVENAGFAGCRLILRRPSPVTQTTDRDCKSDDDQKDWANIVPGALRVGGVRIRDTFYVGGVLTGLDNWAIRDELRMLEDLHTRCKELGLPLLVLGPSRRPDDCWLDRSCVKLDARLRIATGQRAVPYSDLMAISDGQGGRIYRPDGHHLTVSGHAYVADQLEQDLRQIVGVSPCRVADEKSKLLV